MYLYGDSTPSPLRSNYLFFVRDAMELCVHLLLSQERITILRNDLRTTEQQAEAERSRLAGLEMLVMDAAEAANTAGSDSLSMLGVTRVRGAAKQAIGATVADLEARLAADRATAAAKDRAERDGCLDAFGQWVALHPVHEGEWRLSAELEDGDRYRCETAGKTPYGIAWQCTIELAGDHPMARGIRVGDLVTQIELGLPDGSGWKKRAPKLRPQRIDPFSIESFATDGTSYRLALRTTSRGQQGLDIAIEGNEVRLALAGARDEMEIELDVDSRQRLLLMRDRLLEALTNHAGVRRRVLAAAMDDTSLVDRDDLGTVVTRIIEAAAPIVQQIRTHSLDPKELVIRRLLDETDRLASSPNNSRVEIFVSTAELLEKLGRLPRHLRAMFAVLGLEWQRARTPLPLPPDPVPAPSPAVASLGFGSVAPAAIESPAVVQIDAAEPADEPVREGPPESARGEMLASAPVDKRPDSSPSIIIDDSISQPVEKPVEAPAKPATNGDLEVDARDRQALAATVKRIVASARDGAMHTAYAAYAKLFANREFAQLRPHDQRQALKLMVMAKTAPPRSEFVLHAYRSALDRLQVLAGSADDPLDREMIEACEKMLANP